MARVRFAGFEMDLPEGWVDITEDDWPPTLGRAEGLGALQFTEAEPESADVRSVDEQELEAMLDRFTIACELRRCAPTRGLAIAEGIACAADFEAGDFAVRVYFLHDEGSLARITFTIPLDGGAKAEELAEAEAIVGSLALAR